MGLAHGGYVSLLRPKDVLLWPCPIHYMNSSSLMRIGGYLSRERKRPRHTKRREKPESCLHPNPFFQHSIKDLLCQTIQHGPRMAEQTNHSGTHSLLLYFSSRQQQLVDCVNNTSTITFSVVVAERRFKVHSSIIESLLLFLQQGLRRRNSCSRYVIILQMFDQLIMNCAARITANQTEGASPLAPPSPELKGTT